MNMQVVLLRSIAPLPRQPNSQKAMARNKKQPIVKRSLISWVKETSWKLQLLLLLIILFLVFLRVLPLEIQKRLINEVLSQKNTQLLVYYCLIYLGAVVCASLLKFTMNALQTHIGQRVMTDMRRELYSHILKLPLSVFRRIQAGSVSSSIITELAPTSNFVGMAVSVPLSNILTLVAFAVYLIWLNPLLGVITLSIYPIALFVIPMLQSRVNSANRERVEGTRKVADQITESISGVHEVHAHGSFWTEEGKFNALAENLFRIRITWTLYRYGVKVLNNLFVGVGPIIVFILGGYLMIQGKIELGSIVAFLSAQEKLYDPWKELIDFYQIYQDASVRYKKSMSMFDYKTEFELSHDPSQLNNIAGKIEIKNLAFSPSKSVKLLNNINLTVEAGEHLALVGFSGSGKSTLAKCIGQLYNYTGGELLLDGHAVSGLSKQEVIGAIGFISQSPFIYSGTVNDNLLYTFRAIKDYPAGNEDLSEPSLDDKIEVLQQAGVFVDILRFGLNTVLEDKSYPDLEEKILRLRKSFQSNFEEELSDHVEFFHKDHYLFHSSIVENLIFGSPVQNDFSFTALVENTLFLDFLDESGLRLPLLETGAEITRQTVSILENAPKEDMFFVHTPINPAEFEHYCALADVLNEQKTTDLKEKESKLLLDVALRFIPSAHKIIGFQPLLEQLLLTGRKAFFDWCNRVAPGAVSFYDETSYISSQSVLNNIFFGNQTSYTPAIEERVNQCIVFLLVEEDLLEQIAEIGMNFDVGNRGDRLSGGQQQKLAIARVFLKRPKVLIMDEATSALDNASQGRIQKIVENWKNQCTVISVIHRLDMLSSFDKVAVMKEGKVIEYGTPEELSTNKGVLYELIHGT